LEDQTPLSLNIREWDAAQIKDMRKCAQVCNVAPQGGAGPASFLRTVP
jgi:hypothetical protein